MEIALDGGGGFETDLTVPTDQPTGVYIWWAVDDATGNRSNQVRVTIVMECAPSTVEGMVMDGRSGEPVAAATVSVESENAVTDGAGRYRIEGLSAGEYVIAARREGYGTRIENITVSGCMETIARNMVLTAQGAEIEIVAVTSRYAGHVTYMDGVDHEVEFTAHVDWAGHTPGYVRFITRKGVYDVPASGEAVSKRFNMGTDFGVCGKLTVRAFSGAASSAAKVADFTVSSWAPYFPQSGWSLIDRGSRFGYKSSYGFDLKIVDDLINGGWIPEEIPFFGKESVGVRYVPKVTAEIASDGTAQYKLDWGNKAIWEPKAKLLGSEFKLWQHLNIEGEFLEDACSWYWSGDIGLMYSLEARVSGGLRYTLELPSKEQDVEVHLAGGCRACKVTFCGEQENFICTYLFVQGGRGCTTTPSALH